MYYNCKKVVESQKVGKEAGFSVSPWETGLFFFFPRKKKKKQQQVAAEKFPAGSTPHINENVHENCRVQWSLSAHWTLKKSLEATA